MMINLVHKLPELDKKFIELLESLGPEDWNKQTVAKLWKVKDVVAHLLDGNIRSLSALRDEHTGNVPEIKSNQDLLDYLNNLNAEWVAAMKRVSPEMLIALHKNTGLAYCEYYASLDPFGKAGFPVSWAGEEESKNWMHIAREYTEKFLHQQQIRDAVGEQGIINDTFYLPFLDVCMYAMPHNLRDQKAESGNVLKMTITGDVAGVWYFRYEENAWTRVDHDDSFSPISEVSIDCCAAWKLFSKSLRHKDLENYIEIKGDQKLAEAAVEMVSFMA